jgi:hypothetical protein
MNFGVCIEAGIVNDGKCWLTSACSSTATRAKLEGVVLLNDEINFFLIFVAVEVKKWCFSVVPVALQQFGDHPRFQKIQLSDMERRP